MVGSDKPTSLATFVKLTGKSVSGTATTETQRTHRLHKTINERVMAVCRRLPAASPRFRTLFSLLPSDSRVGAPVRVGDAQKSCLDPFASLASTYPLRFAGLPFSGKPCPARCRDR